MTSRRRLRYPTTQRITVAPGHPTTSKDARGAQTSAATLLAAASSARLSRPFAPAHSTTHSGPFPAHLGSSAPQQIILKARQPLSAPAFVPLASTVPPPPRSSPNPVRKAGSALLAAPCRSSAQRGHIQVRRNSALQQSAHPAHKATAARLARQSHLLACLAVTQQHKERKRAPSVRRASSRMRRPQQSAMCAPLVRQVRLTSWQSVPGSPTMRVRPAKT